MTPQQFQALIQKYKAGVLSDAEFEDLRKALAEGRYNDLLEDDIRAVFDSNVKHETWTPAKEDTLWQSIRPVAGTLSSSAAGARAIFRWAIAAAILALIIGIWLLIPHHQTPQTAAIKPAAPGAPGQNKALLILAGGQHIALDDAHTGKLATQGSTNIVKANNGILAYQPAPAPNNETLYNTVITPRGGQYQLQLPDGTKVWLNAASSLRFPTQFTTGERRVQLTGEAYFEVKHLANQPFRVETSHHTIEDIGTSFDVDAYTDEPVTKTTLVEGAIAITGGSKPLRLHPGQQARWQPAGDETVTTNFDLEEVLAWKNGQISFTNADFASLMRQISRWYDVDVRYEGKVPGTHFFGMLSRNVYLPTIVEFLQQNEVHIRLEGRQLIISP